VIRRNPIKRPGAAAVETAFVLIAFFLFVFAVFEYGRLVMVRHIVDNAAREGARLAVVNTHKLKTADIEAQITEFLVGQNLDNLKIGVYRTDPVKQTNLGPWTDAAFGESIAVEVEGEYRCLLPTFGILPDPVQLKTKSIMRSEAN
jgi:Flp pilus assembly protein TadG